MFYQFQEESNGASNEEEDNEDEEDGSSSDDEQEEPVGVIDEAFRAEVQAALGPAMVDMDKEVCLHVDITRWV